MVRLWTAVLLLGCVAWVVRGGGSGPAAREDELEGTIFAHNVSLTSEEHAQCRSANLSNASSSPLFSAGSSACNLKLELRVPSSAIPDSVIGGVRRQQVASGSRSLPAEEARCSAAGTKPCYEPWPQDPYFTRSDELDVTLLCDRTDVSPRCRLWCHDKASFLGVGNPICIGQNPVTTMMVVALIVVLSLFFEVGMHHLRHHTHCPMLSKIINQCFAEMMVLGWISFCLFAMSKAGLTDAAAAQDATLGPVELLHFKEFFHYVIFISLLAYIAIVAVLVAGTHFFIPRLWAKTESDQRHADLMGGEDSPASVAYAATKSYLERQHWLLRKLNVPLMLRWYSRVNRMGYQLARQESKPVYVRLNLRCD
jgi:hypothetical protein